MDKGGDRVTRTEKRDPSGRYGPQDDGNTKYKIKAAAKNVGRDADATT